MPRSESAITDERAREALGGQRGAFERVDGDVDLGRAAVADLLAVVEHRGFVLLALADHDDAVHRDGVEHEAHRVDCGLVGGDLVAVADPAGGGQCGRFGDADQFEREVAVGVCLRLREDRAFICGANPSA